ncbi:uncharacterized protein LOC132042550 [Lycium ferocissimum]|uniref:uncharacterized protein LOC132042550 n=1 Tax=Lycium ferocissimum TaxID=112874 RepID=UPI002815DDC6|nr:uncharacterized protein LOC132042550 [Lycium ferocissimum]
MHVIDTKTSYNMLLGRPWIHENKVVPSSYYQCLKYLEGSIKKKIVADDKPFTEAESHFVDAKFYLKNYIVREVKVDDIATTKSDKVATKRADETIEKAGVDAEVPHPSMNKGNIVSLKKKKKTTPVLCYVPKMKKEEGQPSETQGKLLGDFVAQNPPQNMALPTKRTNESFDPNAYKLFAYEYKKPPPVRISIRKASINYITVEDESVASNKRLSVFDYLRNSTAKASVFERLGPLKMKKKNKFHRNYQSVKMLALPRTQKDIQSLIPSRMRRQTNLVVSCGEVLKAKSHTVVYTKERDEDEESVGSSYHITAQSDQNTSFQMEVAKKLEDISSCYHISFNDGDPQEYEDARDAPPELEEGVKTIVDSLKEVNLGTDEDPRPTYLSAFLTADEEDTYMEILKEYRDVFTWSYKEMPGLGPKVAVHHLAVKNGARPVKGSYNAWPKDDFPLPIPELMIDATIGYEAMSFMDGSSDYNQIRMALKDEELTTFRTPKGINCYKVMPFGLKNAGVIYQRAMQNIFDDLLHKNVE